MPNLNTKSDMGKSSSSSSSPSPSSSGTSKSGGFPKLPFIILAVIIVLSGIIFGLNKMGIIKLWGKKKPVVTQVQPPPQTNMDTEGLATFDNNQMATAEKPAVDTTKKVKKEMPKKEEKPKIEKTELSTSSTGMYGLQVSAWESRSMANEEVTTYTKIGYPAFVQKHGGLYRVYVGRYETKKDAIATGEKILPMLETGYEVMKLRK